MDNMTERQRRIYNYRLLVQHQEQQAGRSIRAIMPALDLIFYKQYLFNIHEKINHKATYDLIDYYGQARHTLPRRQRREIDKYNRT